MGLINPIIINLPPTAPVQPPVIIVEGAGSVDGGFSAAVYGGTTPIDGGAAASVYDETEIIDGGDA